MRTHRSLELCDGAVGFEPPCTLRSRHAGDDLTVSSLAGEDWLEVCCAGSWACVAPLTGRPLVLANGEGLSVVIEMQRLDLQGAYDPGGLHYIDFVERPQDGEVIVLYEHGAVALREGGVRWHAIHNQVSARRASEDLGVMKFEGERAFGIVLENGEIVSEVDRSR